MMKLNGTFTRVDYVILGLIGVFYVLLARDYNNAAITLGIALAFDPFDPTVKWEDRPRYQKGWLIVHLAVVAGLFGASVGIK
jgi:hypothetical protein